MYISVNFIKVIILSHCICALLAVGCQSPVRSPLAGEQPQNSESSEIVYCVSLSPRAVTLENDGRTIILLLQAETLEGCREIGPADIESLYLNRFPSLLQIRIEDANVRMKNTSIEHVRASEQFATLSHNFTKARVGTSASGKKCINFEVSYVVDREVAKGEVCHILPGSLSVRDQIRVESKQIKIGQWAE